MTIAIAVMGIYPLILCTFQELVGTVVTLNSRTLTRICMGCYNATEVR